MQQHFIHFIKDRISALAKLCGTCLWCSPCNNTAGAVKKYGTKNESHLSTNDNPKGKGSILVVVSVVGVSISLLIRCFLQTPDYDEGLLTGQKVFRGTDTKRGGPLECFRLGA